MVLFRFGCLTVRNVGLTGQSWNIRTKQNQSEYSEGVRIKYEVYRGPEGSNHQQTIGSLIACWTASIFTPDSYVFCSYQTDTERTTARCFYH